MTSMNPGHLPRAHPAYRLGDDQFGDGGRDSFILVGIQRSQRSNTHAQVSGAADREQTDPVERSRPESRSSTFTPVHRTDSS